MLQTASTLLQLNRARLLLLRKPSNTSVDSLLQRPDGFVAEHRSGLCDVVVSRHGGDVGSLHRERGGLLDDAAEDFRAEANELADFAADDPDTLGAGLVASSTPDGARKVPEVHRLVVCDEEGLAVNLFMIQRSGLGCGRGQQALGSEQVGVSDVADVRVVEDVVVVAELEVGLVGAIRAHEAGE